MKVFTYKWFGSTHGNAFSISPKGIVTTIVVTANYAAITQLSAMLQQPDQWVDCTEADFSRLKNRALEVMGLVDQDALLREIIETSEATRLTLLHA